MRPNTKGIIAVLVALAISVACAPKPPAADKELIRMLVGTWQAPVEESLVTLASLTFHEDGKFAAEGVLIGGGRITCDGKWRVVDGILLEEIASSSHRQVVPVGEVFKSRILKLDGSSLETRNEDGQIERYGRKKG